MCYMWTYFLFFVRKNKGDNNMSDRNLINRAIFEVKANIRELEAALGD